MDIFLSLFLFVLSYGSPVKIPIQLAGNFGEPRPNHFHCGIDVKTNQAENLGIYSIADGYVSRIIIERYGFGNALVIAHPDGHSSYYVHLNRFAPQIEAKLMQLQYAKQTYAGDFYLREGEIPIKQGQFIALSGNTGSSQGPHLHLELHHTTSGLMRDPLNKLGFLLTDKTPPIAHSFKVYPIIGEGVFEREQQSDIYNFTERVFTAWGKVGFGIDAVDKMDFVYNNFGVRSTTLYCDDKVVFSVDVDNIPETANPLINVWGDYEYYMASKKWYLRSFITPANTLPMLRSDASKGVINFNEQRIYHLRYVLKDYFGNQTIKEITVKGEPAIIQKASSKPQHSIQPQNRKTWVNFSGASLLLEKDALPHELSLQIPKSNASNMLSSIYQFSQLPYLLLKPAKLSIRIPGSAQHTDKIYIAGRNANDIGNQYLMYCGGKYRNGSIEGYVKDLSLQYFLAYDMTPPNVVLLSSNAEHIACKIEDAQSGIKDYKVFVDDNFVLFSHIQKEGIIKADLRSTPLLPKGIKRNVKIIVTDNMNNQTMKTTEIIY